MANEAAQRYAESDGSGYVIQDMTCYDAEAIEKGSLLMYSGARIVAKCNRTGAPIAGIAAREKVANDGRTQIAVYKKGYFDMYFSGATSLGQPLIAMSNGNAVVGATSGAFASIYSGACILGYCEEVGTAGGTHMVRLDL